MTRGEGRGEGDQAGDKELGWGLHWAAFMGEYSAIQDDKERTLTKGAFRFVIFNVHWQWNLYIHPWLRSNKVLHARCWGWETGNGLQLDRKWQPFTTTWLNATVLFRLSEAAWAVINLILMWNLFFFQRYISQNRWEDRIQATTKGANELKTNFLKYNLDRHMKVCGRRRARQGILCAEFEKNNSCQAILQSQSDNQGHKCAAACKSANVRLLHSSAQPSLGSTGAGQSCHWHKLILKYTKYSKERWGR